MFRNFTARDMLRFQTCEALLGCNQLNAAERYAQASMAQKLRNFWFTATAQTTADLAPAPPVIPVSVVARTPTFSDPLVITEILSMSDIEVGSDATATGYFPTLQVKEYGGPERSTGLDYFGLSGPMLQRLMLKHEKNFSIALATTLFGPYDDLHPFQIGHVPRLLAPYQQLEFRWFDTVGNDEETEVNNQAGIRAVRHLAIDNPYGYFTPSTDADIKNYIAGSVPETFFLEATLRFEDFPAQGATVQIKTPQQERPLLILGATCNVEGVQAELYDESKYYQFTVADTPLTRPVAARYKSVPLALWASHSDFRNTNIYNMWPVPHLLERGVALTIRLTNGTFPNSDGTTFSSTILTKQEQDARIVFICRTV